MDPSGVDASVLESALRIAADRGIPVPEVSLGLIAVDLGVSRSTVVRRLGGSRAALDAAAAAHPELGTPAPPVRERATLAAAELIAARGLGAMTLEKVAEAAACSVASLHATFGTRDGLLAETFEKHAPFADIAGIFVGALSTHGMRVPVPPGGFGATGPMGTPPEAALRNGVADGSDASAEEAGRPGPDAGDSTGAELHAMVRDIYRGILAVLYREPRLFPAALAQTLADPTEPDGRTIRSRVLPKFLPIAVAVFDTLVRAGHLRDAPRILLVQQFAGPVVFHVITRGPIEEVAGVGTMPDLEAVAEEFTQAFLRGAARGGSAPS